MKKRIFKFISMTLLAAILVCSLPAEFSYAALKSVNPPSQVTTFKSTTSFEDEYVRAYVTEPDILKVIYNTPQQTSLFRLSLYRVGENKGDIDLDIFVEPKVRTNSDGSQSYGFTYYLDMSRYNVPDGYYNLYIRHCRTAEQAQTLDYKSCPILYKNMEIKVSNGNVKILRYKDVMAYNKSIQDIGDIYSTDLYLDTSLEDIRFVLKDPVSGTYSNLGYRETDFLRRVSADVTSGALDDYGKLLKIYEYTASNFYYDTVAFQTHSNQYANPYDNIYNFQYGLSSRNSSYGKVYTTCQGYSAIFIALARAQGIPSRLVYGHRLAVPSNDWLTEKNIDVKDHWWVEAYVDGRWIFVDPTVGTTNKYNSSTGVWSYSGLTNYTYFDPSDEQIATSHVYMNIYPDYRYGKYISNEYEIATLTDFLNTYNPEVYKCNGAILNSGYSYYDKSTWGDGTKSHFMTDGRGNVAQIQWSRKGFSGELNLPGFTSMTLLSSHHNNYESVDLSGCSALSRVYLQNNQGLDTINLTDCKKLTLVNAKANTLSEANIYVNGSNRSFVTGEHGDFSFYMYTPANKDFTLYSRPDIGYKLGGIYSTVTGNLISTAKTYTFNPKAKGYRLVFSLDPDSFKYTLSLNDSGSTKVPYIQAVAKRLNELGYYMANSDYYSYLYGSSNASVGTETVYTAQLETSVIKFQVMHDLPDTGIMDELTWSALFNDSAKQMVSDYEYEQILTNYEIRKLMEAQAQSEMDEIHISAKTQLTEEGIDVYWTTPETPTPDGYEIWKASKKTGTFTLLSDANDGFYSDTVGLIKGKTYYYKLRAYKLVGEKKIYSQWSNTAYRTMRTIVTINEY